MAEKLVWNEVGQGHNGGVGYRDAYPTIEQCEASIAEVVARLDHGSPVNSPETVAVHENVTATDVVRSIGERARVGAAA